MLAQRTYWIQTKTNSSLDSMDDEEQAALVSIMRNLAGFCGINILTYSIDSGDLSMLVSCPAREHHLRFFEDTEGELSGSGRRRLLQHLRNLYTEKHILSLEEDILYHEELGENTEPLLERYTRRIGIPRKFAEGVNEAFTRWMKKNRPQLFQQIEGRVCRKGINQTYIEQLLKQRNIAEQMDRQALLYDDGSDPRVHWCGFADALRGDEDALDGLRELMRSPANNAQDIVDLGYGSKRQRTKPPVGLSDAKSKKRRSITKPRPERARIRDTPIGLGSTNVQTPPEPPATMGKGVKFAFLAVFLMIVGSVTAVAVKEWRSFKASKSDTAEMAQKEAVAQAKQELQAQQQSKQAAFNDLLYEPEARQLAEDFAKNGDPTIRLKMSRNPELTIKHMADYSEDALSLKAAEVTFMDVVYLGGIMAARFIAKFERGEPRLVCVVATTDGLRVDWDCYARHNTAAWEKLLQGTSKSAELRVFAERSDYYNFEFRDDSKWISYTIKSPDHDHIFYAYAPRGTTTAKLLDAAMPDGQIGKNVQLTVQVSAGGGDPKWKQLVIDRVYAFGWVRPEDDIEDTFRSKVHALAQ